MKICESYFYFITYFLSIWILYVKGHSLKGSLSSAVQKHFTILDKQWTETSMDEKMVDESEISEAEQNLGHNYFQGDFLMTNKQKRILDHLINHHSRKHHDQPDLRGLIKDIGRTWKDGVVYFHFEDDVDSKQEEIVKKAMKHWEEKSCLRFKERGRGDEDYILFKGRNRCASYVGRKGGKQNLYVGNRFKRCKVGNIIHEIGHAVGFFHEQTRPDRDKFVKILWKNLIKGKRHNFHKFSSSIIDSRDVQYDYGSIMHYGRMFFSEDHMTPSIVPKQSSVYIGQRNGLSKLDVRQAKMLYNCNEGHMKRL